VGLYDRRLPRYLRARPRHGMSYAEYAVVLRAGRAISIGAPRKTDKQIRTQYRAGLRRDDSGKADAAATNWFVHHNCKFDIGTRVRAPRVLRSLCPPSHARRIGRYPLSRVWDIQRL
jgi:hypothetical protein